MRLREINDIELEKSITSFHFWYFLVVMQSIVVFRSFFFVRGIFLFSNFTEFTNTKVSGNASRFSSHDKYSSMYIFFSTIEKINYNWKTEFNQPPKWLKEPYPWDWMCVAEKK